jgi:hypothetical protein
VAQDPATVVAADGKVSVAFMGKDGRTYLASSPDGATWGSPEAVSPAGLNVTTFVTLISTKQGLVANYLATASPSWSSADPSDAPDGTAWHLWASLQGQNGIWSSHKLTPGGDPVQVGCIFLNGGVTARPACGNLFDFMGATETRDGFAVSFVDGCPQCSSSAGSRDDALSVALVRSSGQG